MNRLIETIISEDAAVRNRTAEDLLAGKSPEQLLQLTSELETFRQTAANIYQRVRACLLIFAAYRFYFSPFSSIPASGKLPLSGIRRMLRGEWESAIQILRPHLDRGPNTFLLSALAEAYYRRAFRYLLEQVKLSISRSRGNEWMFRIGILREYPLRVRKDYLKRDPVTGLYPVGYDCCPVRIDPCHSGWSDIFFLAMDFPAGARVINLSVDITIRGKGKPRPPVECFSRVIEKPVIRLVSLDLRSQKEMNKLAELFNFGGDELDLLKAGVIAAGIVPAALEKKHITLEEILRKLVGPKRGLEVVTRVRNLPRGSRMAASTTLLNTVITRLMRMTGQISLPEGGLNDDERRLVVSRTILGEWLGGSGGGWQDSGGLWPGIKLIQAVEAKPGDPEFKRSRGRLLPRCEVIPPQKLPPDIEELLRRSVILIHGGLAQNVGPVLEMVTEKYLLRYRKEWLARRSELKYFNGIVGALRRGNMKELGRLTSKDWEKGTKVIVPRATNAYTEDLIRRMKQKWGKKCRGFLMLGGAAGGGMAFIVNPRIHQAFARDVLKVMKELKGSYERALHFAREPVVFDFALNREGIRGALLRGNKSRMPEEYYQIVFPSVSLIPSRAVKKKAKAARGEEKIISAAALKKEYGFDGDLHGRNKKLLKSGRIGIKENRLPRATLIRDAGAGDVHDPFVGKDPDYIPLIKAGRKALREGRAAVVTFSGGVGSRWTEGAGVVKALNPCIFLKGKHRSFLEIHLAKSRKVSRDSGCPVQHVFTTSFLTHRPIAFTLKGTKNFGHPGAVHLSRGCGMVQRLYPTERDLRAGWETKLKRIRNKKTRKLEKDRLEAFVRWARDKGEGESYRENIPRQRFYPPGHWYEIPNLIRNGTLGIMLKENPGLQYLLAHNLDTVGATLDPALLGRHISLDNTLSFEVTPRRFQDRGGFLARVNGHLQLLEAMALPREEDSFKLSYYNSLTNWITIDKLLGLFGLSRRDILKSGKDEKTRRRIDRAIRKIEKRIPTYVTLKEVQLTRESGQTGIFPVIQCEKLWGDMTHLKEPAVGYLVVEYRRAQQLKDPNLLDHWIRDGSLEHLSRLTIFNR